MHLRSHPRPDSQRKPAPQSHPRLSCARIPAPRSQPRLPTSQRKPTPQSQPRPPVTLLITIVWPRIVSCEMRGQHIHTSQLLLALLVLILVMGSFPVVVGSFRVVRDCEHCRTRVIHITGSAFPANVPLLTTFHTFPCLHPSVPHLL